MDSNTSLPLSAVMDKFSSGIQDFLSQKIKENSNLMYAIHFLFAIYLLYIYYIFTINFLLNLLFMLTNKYGKAYLIFIKNVSV